MIPTLDGRRSPPITAADLARVAEYRMLGLSWERCAAILGVGKSRLIAAVRASQSVQSDARMRSVAV